MNPLHPLEAKEEGGSPPDNPSGTDTHLTSHRVSVGLQVCNNGYQHLLIHWSLVRRFIINKVKHVKMVFVCSSRVRDPLWGRDPLVDTYCYRSQCEQAHQMYLTDF